MSSFATILSYFQTCASALLAVSHDPAAPLGRFSTYNPDEVLDGLRSKLDVRGPHLVLLIEKPEEAYDDNGADGQWVEHRLGFVLLRQCAAEDYPAQRAAEDAALTAGKQIAALIRQDARAGAFLMPQARLSNNGRFEVELIGPAFDECYGCRFVFGWAEPGPLRLDPSAWGVS